MQTKHKASRRLQNAACKLIRAVLPEHHQFPRSIWRALRVTTQSGWGLAHEEVAYCAQKGVMPSRANRKEVLCPEPTVYYGADKSRPNCKTCGDDTKKKTYIIPIRNHIQVHFTHPPSATSPPVPFPLFH